MINHYHHWHYPDRWNLDSKTMSLHLETIGHSSQAALSQKTMKLINCELTSEHRNIQIQIQCTDIQIHKYIEDNEGDQLSIWLLLVWSFATSYILPLHLSVNFYPIQFVPRPKCNENASKVRIFFVEKLQILHKNPVLKSCMHNAEKEFTSSKAIWWLGGK